MWHAPVPLPTTLRDVHLPAPAPVAADRARRFVADFAAGVGLFLRGLGTYARDPGLVLLGVAPALISGALYLAGFVVLIYHAAGLAEMITPFADGWSGWARTGVRLVAGIALVGAGGLLGALTFTAVTLVIGDPFYEAISERVEARHGGVPNEVEVPWWRSLRRSLVDSLRLLLRSALVGIPLALAGLVPVVGQLVVPVIAALVGGWFLTVELVGVPFYRRGLRVDDRRRVLRQHRPLALGFGVVVFLCFLIPLGAVLLMPAAVAGAALLSRRVLGEPLDRPVEPPPPHQPASVSADAPRETP